jgi:hypothetical protein
MVQAANKQEEMLLFGARIYLRTPNHLRQWLSPANPKPTYFLVVSALPWSQLI